MPQLIGIALWALIPGSIAKKKGRSFWGYYFLSFLISPLITMIITFCLSNISDNKQTQENYNDIIITHFCRNCGAPLADRNKFCHKCGTEIVEDEVPVLAEENKTEN